MYFDSIVATRVENEPDAVVKLDAVASVAVTRVDNDPDTVTYADAVDSVFVIRVESDDENAFTSVGKPEIEPENEPVKPAVDVIEPVTWAPPLSTMRPFFIRN